MADWSERRVEHRGPLEQQFFVGSLSPSKPPGMAALVTVARQAAFDYDGEARLLESKRLAREQAHAKAREEALSLEALAEEKRATALARRHRDGLDGSGAPTPLGVFSSAEEESRCRGESGGEGEKRGGGESEQRGRGEDKEGGGASEEGSGGECKKGGGAEGERRRVASRCPAFYEGQCMRAREADRSWTTYRHSNRTFE